MFTFSVIASVTLQGGRYRHEGIVEMTLGNDVGTICANVFARNDARTLCNMLGYR